MRKIFSALFLLTLASCANSELLRHGKISLHNTADKNSFIFSVDEEFGEKFSASPQDKKNPQLNQAESGLLTALLKQKNYCESGFGAPKFVITSKQEKIFDMTFAHLIQQNYNAKSVAPKMFYGQCIQ